MFKCESSEILEDISIIPTIDFFYSLEAVLVCENKSLYRSGMYEMTRDGETRLFCLLCAPQLMQYGWALSDTETKLIPEFVDEEKSWADLVQSLRLVELLDIASHEEDLVKPNDFTYKGEPEPDEGVLENDKNIFDMLYLAGVESELRKDTAEDVPEGFTNLMDGFLNLLYLTTHHKVDPLTEMQKRTIRLAAKKRKSSR